MKYLILLLFIGLFVVGCESFDSGIEESQAIESGNDESGADQSGSGESGSGESRADETHLAEVDEPFLDKAERDPSLCLETGMKEDCLETLLSRNVSGACEYVEERDLCFFSHDACNEIEDGELRDRCYYEKGDCHGHSRPDDCFFYRAMSDRVVDYCYQISEEKRRIICGKALK